MAFNFISGGLDFDHLVTDRFITHRLANYGLSRRCQALACTLCALLFLLCCPVWANAAGKKYALVVGVTSYRPGQPLPRLPYTENDANDLAKVLTAGGYHVVLMTQAVGRTEGNEVLAPLSDFIGDQLDLMLSNPNLKEDDIVLVALAGHGVQYELLEGTKKSAKFFFCPTDAEITRITSANDISASNNLIDLAELYGALNDCKAGGKLMLVDACRNDPSKAVITRSLSSVTLPPLPPPPGGTAVFFSCSAHQQAFEDKDLQHGVFFHHVIQGLKGEADVGNEKRPADGKITLAELSEQVSSGTYDFVRNKYRAKQAPELKGEFLLSIPLLTLASRSSEGMKPLKPAPVTPPQNISFEGTQAGEVRELIEASGMKFVWCPPGTFKMGSDAPVDVTLTRGFWLGQTEVTQKQWNAVMSAAPWKAANAVNVMEGDDYPVSWVTHGDAGDGKLEENSASHFCQKLTQQARNGLPPGWKYVLPTEAQWEYACRAGTQTKFSFGNDESQLELYAWYNKNTFDVGEKYAHPVGAKRANAWGLLDMHGNVNEWCSDWYELTLRGGRDPSGPAKGSERVFRGGNWFYDAYNCQLGVRGSATATNDSERMYGFRVAAVSFTGK